MRRFSYLISKYVLQSILPYFAISWLLLSVILFVQQAGRFSELIFNTAIPSTLILQLTIALIPNVIAFTCPVAALVGVIIGLSRMQRDSELVVLRAAGVGNAQIVIPTILIGVLLSMFALFINLKGVPFAAQIVRKVGLEAAIRKLESPIEPGVFNSELKGYIVFVKSVDIEEGNWQKIFIYQDNNREPGNERARLITAKEGKIDTNGEKSEIVLRDANITTLGRTENNQNKLAAEHVTELRMATQTDRGDLVKKLSEVGRTPKEMGLIELAAHAKTLEGEPQIDASILLHRRLLLSITPLLFSLLGAGLVSKFSRGGRGFGAILGLASLIIYYLLALLGEQLARTGRIGVFTGVMIPSISCLLATGWLFFSQRLRVSNTFSLPTILNTLKYGRGKGATAKRAGFAFTTRLLDMDLVFSVVKNYLLALGFLTAIFMIFTAFENWKFAGTMNNGIALLGAYLFFLIPFVYVQIAPSALMIGTLATYIIKSRQNEIVSWTAAGQSIYRLLFPCFALMIFFGLFNFAVQEWIYPAANIKQDSYLATIRSRKSNSTENGRIWIAGENSIYSFIPASDNDTTTTKDISAYQLNPDSWGISGIVRSSSARWLDNQIQFQEPLTNIVVRKDGTFINNIAPKITESVNPFAKTITKPSHLTLFDTRSRIGSSTSDLERASYAVSFHKKLSTIVLPFIIVLFTAPFALSLRGKGAVVTLGYAVGVWLVFMGSINVMEQFGISGYISPTVAVWGGLIVFTLIGSFLMTRVKT